MAKTKCGKEGQTFIARQGDVLILRVPTLPPNLEPIARENGKVVLAHGEVTGHAHAIKSQKAALFRDPKLMAIFMTVSGEPVALEHEEHSTIAIPPGNYEVRRQREYVAPEIARQVAD